MRCIETVPYVQVNDTGYICDIPTVESPQRITIFGYPLGIPAMNSPREKMVIGFSGEESIKLKLQLSD